MQPFRSQTIGLKLAASFCIVITLGFAGYLHAVRAMNACLQKNRSNEAIIHRCIALADDVSQASDSMAYNTMAYVYSRKSNYLEDKWEADQASDTALTNLRDTLSGLRSQRNLMSQYKEIADLDQAQCDPTENQALRLARSGKFVQAIKLYEMTYVPKRLRLRIEIADFRDSMEIYRDQVERLEVQSAHQAVVLGWIIQALILALSLMIGLTISRTTASSIHATIEAQIARKSAQEQLERRTFYDVLTNLPNRASLLERLERILISARGNANSVCALFVAIDNLKFINDSLGRTAGDQAIVRITERLHQCVRPSDMIARTGGDEFAILVQGPNSPSDCVEIADRICHHLEAMMTIAHQDVFVTASVGIVMNTGAETHADILLQNADIAVSRAKLGGKGKYAIFDASMKEEASERLLLETELRHAIQNDELRLHYQPIVNIETGVVTEVEALVRWQHPTRGLLPPGVFVGLAEETGLILEMGRQVLVEACRQTREWQCLRPDQRPLGVAVNLSAKQFQQEDLVDEIAEILRATGLPPTSLRLEITETAMMDNAQSAIGQLQKLKELGIRIAIDDFGTGYSSMAYLSSFPIDTLKIDRSFVNKMHEPDGFAIVHAIVTLAKSLRLTVTGEGVETSEQLQLLQTVDCTEVQGYYFSRPLSPDALETLLGINRQELIAA